MRRGTALLALILILVGVYSLLVEMGVSLPDWDRIWPIAPFAGGIALLVNYLRSERKDHGVVFWGTALTLSGLFFFLITLGEGDYAILSTWWPVFVAVAGISFLAQWLAQGLQDRNTIFLAIVTLLFGAGALVLNLRPNLVPEMARLWPAALILLGLVLLLRVVFNRRTE